MFFINLLIVLYDVSFRIIDTVNEKLTISLYLDDAYDKNSWEVIWLRNDILAVVPEISLTYKTKEEVLEDLRDRDPELVNILERQNPLPETITLENIPLEKYGILNSVIEWKSSILSQGIDWESDEEYFSTYSKQFEQINRVIATLNILQIGLYIVIITFLVSIAVIVYSIIGNFIYYYKDEIYITRLVWGSKMFIYGPFTIQWMMYVGVAFVISTLIFLIFLSNLKYLLQLGNMSEVYSGNLVLMLLIEAWVFLFVGGMSGFLSSRRYLKK